MIWKKEKSVPLHGTPDHFFVSMALRSIRRTCSAGMAMHSRLVGFPFSASTDRLNRRWISGKLPLSQVHGAADRLFHGPRRSAEAVRQKRVQLFPLHKPRRAGAVQPRQHLVHQRHVGAQGRDFQEGPFPVAAAHHHEVGIRAEHPFNAVRFGGRDIHTAQPGFFFRDVKEENSTDVMVTARAMPQMARMVMTPVLTALAYWPSTT